MTTVTSLFYEWRKAAIPTDDSTEKRRGDLDIRNDIIATPSVSLLEISYKLELLADDVDDDMDSIQVSLLVHSIRFDMRRAYSFRANGGRIAA